jgi:uncharacterized spore protein YtfJ
MNGRGKIGSVRIDHRTVAPTAVKEAVMENVKDVLKTSLEELERVLSTKTVVGEPIVIEGNTLIPLISIGFGFGAGGGTGTCKKGDDEGHGTGTGGGGGIRPVALVIVNKDGVRVEPIKSGMASAFEHLGETLGRAMQEKEKKGE